MQVLEAFKRKKVRAKITVLIRQNTKLPNYCRNLVKRSLKPTFDPDFFKNLQSVFL
jgi:hypothetical protein